mgnify:CR=1 FL=1
MSLRDNLKPYTIEALQRLGGSGALSKIRAETIKILIRENKEHYIFQSGKNLYQQRWTLELLKEEGTVENGCGVWKFKEVANLFDVVST